MDYSKVHFGKSLTELQYSDVEKFFTVERIESDQLEFKSYAGKVSDNYTGLIRTLCAFLNSKGGLLIWGAPKGEKVQGRNAKVFKGDLTPINEIIEKESCISKCSDSISPLPAGIRLNVLTKDNSCICVFEVDESEYAPHQTDNTYLMRIDGQTKPAPHHYVEALFKRIRNPFIEGYLHFFSQSEPVQGILRIQFSANLFNWTPMQNVLDPFYKIRIHSDNGVFDEPYNALHHFDDMKEFRFDSIKKALHFGEPAMSLHTIAINISEFRELTIWFSFGGSNTEAKLSKYKFQLNNINLTNFESNLVERSENVSYKEIQEKLGYTRELTIKKVFLRKEI